MEQLTAAVRDGATEREGRWYLHYFRLVMAHPPLLAALYAKIDRYIEERSVDDRHSVSIDAPRPPSPVPPSAFIN